MRRTEYCGAFDSSHIGSVVCACGWVETKRDMGGIIFIDLKDREGTLQVVFDARNLTAEHFADAEQLKNQSVIEVCGVIRERDEETYNPKLKTGCIELAASSIEVLSASCQLPFSPDDSEKVREELRLKYRFLDIRRPRMIENLRFRHKVQKAAQDYLDDHGFIYVETPMLTKSTPEGARDYLVPSRVHPGSFYALPQSPQIFKQLLMVGGIDKYYQVARCFRDEDLRADRQPEFTQVDMEMSFVDQEDILVHLEKLFKHIFKTVMGREIVEPFIRLTWHEAMDVYGSDKPDLRFDLPICDVTDIMAKTDFSVFKNAIKKGGVVRVINVKGGTSAFTRSDIDELTRKAVSFGAKGMAWIAIKENGELNTILTKYFPEGVMEELFRRVDAQPGDFILFSADKLSTVRRTLGGLRGVLADMLRLRKEDDYVFLFVTDFPQFEYSEEEKRYVAMHHPFTMPRLDQVDMMLTEPEKVCAQAYDVVLNGVELGSGSIRIHRSDIQKKMFQALGFSDEEIQERFGFMVNAFKYGTPPHGGFAFGLDRFVMLLLQETSLREVIAFPKIKDASCPMTDAPSPVDASQLEELKLLHSLIGESMQSGGKKPKKKVDIDVDNVARLARLKLSPQEKQTLSRDMAEIITFADTLSELDTDGVPITAHVVPMANVFRDDEPQNSFTREELLKNAPSSENGYICVPQVVE